MFGGVSRSSSAGLLALSRLPFSANDQALFTRPRGLPLTPRAAFTACFRGWSDFPITAGTAHRGGGEEAPEVAVRRFLGFLRFPPPDVLWGL